MLLDEYITVPDGGDTRSGVGMPSTWPLSQTPDGCQSDIGLLGSPDWNISGDHWH